MPLTRLVVGNSINGFPGRTFNTLCDYAERRDAPKPPRPRPHSLQYSLAATIRNDTTYDLAAGEVVGLSTILGDPITDEAIRYSGPVFIGVVPSAAYENKFGVMLSPCAAGGIGKAMILGAAWAKIDVNNAAHEFATIKAGTQTSLKSAASPGYPIVWKESGTGLRLCLVLVGGAGGAGLRHGKLSAALTGPTATVNCVVWAGTTPAATSETLSVGCWLLGTSETIASGAKVDLAFINGGWQVVAAECSGGGGYNDTTLRNMIGVSGTATGTGSFA